MVASFAPFRILGARAARVTAAAVGIVWGVGIVAGIIRVLPWLVSRTVPVEVALPFLRGLLAVALETGLFVGPPLGFALAAALSVERFEARALHAIGVGPYRLMASTLPLVGVFAALAVLSAAAWGRELSAPGRLARALLHEGREACQDLHDGARAVEIPFVRATWLCQKGAPPRLVARLPGAAEAPFTASAIEIDDRLDALVASDLRMRLPQEPPLRLHIERARVRGFTPWARVSTLSPMGRAALLSTTSAWLSLLAGWVVLRFGMSGRVEVLALGGAGPMSALGALSLIDRASLPAATYLAVPLAATVAIFTVLAVRGCVPERSLR